MITFRRYGALIWVSAGLLVSTLGTRWWEDECKIVRGQHVAECVAAAAERLYVGYLTGTNAPYDGVSGYTTNYTYTTNFSTTVHFSTVSGNGYSVSPTNLVFTTANWSTMQYVTFSASVSAGASWTPYLKRDGENTGYPITVTHAGAPPNGIDTIGGAPSVIGTIQVEGNRVRVADGTSQALGFVLTEPPDTNPVVTTNQAPGDAIIDKSMRVDDFIRWRDISSSALFRLRDMTAYDVYAHTNNDIGGPSVDLSIFWTPEEPVDGDSIASVEQIWSEEPYTTTNGSAQVIHHWYFDWTNRFSGVHVTSTRTPSALCNQLTDTTNSDWAVNGLGVHRPMEYEFYTLANTVPFSLSPSYPSFFGGYNCWWPLIGMGTNAYALRCEVVRSNAVSGYNYNITTSNLEQARTLATNMYRTVAIADIGLMSYTGAESVVRSSTIDTTGITGGSVGSPSPAEMVVALIGTETRGAGTPSWALGRLYSCSYKYLYHQELDGLGARSDQARGRWAAEQAVFSGCSLPYPSDYALTNGYVSRVRIFAVGGASTVPAVDEMTDGFGQPIFALPKLWVTNSSFSTFSAVTPQPDAYDGFNDTLLSHHCPHPKRPDGSFEWLGISYDDYALRHLMDKPATNLLSLVLDVSSPSSRPLFSLGSLVDYDPPSEGIVSRYAHYNDPGVPNSEEACTWASFVHSVAVYRFVIVVDWNWKHLNPSQVFEPEPWTPPWSQLNTQ